MPRRLDYIAPRSFTLDLRVRPRDTSLNYTPSCDKPSFPCPDTSKPLSIPSYRTQLARNQEESLGMLCLSTDETVQSICEHEVRVVDITRTGKSGIQEASSIL